jgi:hypothetical protein
MTPQDIDQAILQYARDREHHLPVTVDQLQTACSVLRRAKIKAATIRSRIRLLAKLHEITTDERDAITRVLAPAPAAEPLPEWMEAANRAGAKVKAARKLIQAHETVRFLRRELHYAKKERLPSLVERFQAALDDVLGELYPEGLPADMAAYTAAEPDEDLDG